MASKESGCREKAVSGQNSDGSRDFCLYQLNREAHTAKDLDTCIRRAWEKYEAGRIGVKNWSAWYAVCTPGNSPTPKYPQFINNCN